MRGILLAGGMGTRLQPMTLSTNKHLLPVYDKPMIYYPLSTLMLAGIKDITIITTTEGTQQFKKILGNGNQWGINLTYAAQDAPNGIADGINIALQGFSTRESVLVILGDNIFYGQGLGRNILNSIIDDKCVVWTQTVNNPEDFGIATLKNDGTIKSIVEKPKDNLGNLAVTGLYYFPSDIIDVVKLIKKSDRGEYEVTYLLNNYLERNLIEQENLSRGVYWQDAGNVESLMEASQFVRVIQMRQGLLIGSPEEVALRMGFITDSIFEIIVKGMKDSEYKQQLTRLVK